ncbi:MAG: metallophosphoesterase [Hamadaea sp.]|uniref:metallophosphoesterase n=1 Tax=Hamadaea sp. TaxID=2024425 RepID=UPI0017C087B9|nr:metallophosphoesterase [Hamadaea sp.]NUO58449.1 metallophosphoesterase [Hamadaea sp.]NUR71209.1 metallophosphoesterase [Hamadaea sp.]NUT17740.1 metallophosphoesterase [Hamadaea sp.]
MAAFLIFGLVVAGAIHYYLWFRLVRSTTRPGRARRIGTGLVVAAVVVLIGALVLTRLDANLEWLAILGYVWLAVMFYLLVTLALLEIPAFVAKRLSGRGVRGAPDAGALAAAPAPAEDVADVDRPAVRTPEGESRRLFVARAVAITAGLVSAGTVGYGVTQALGRPVLKRREIALAKLPRAMDGYRVALVSDIHLGPLAGRKHTERIVEIINGLDADIVTVVGDLVDGTVAQLGDDAAPLRLLQSKHGAYFVTGNHEYYSGYQEWIQEVAELGLKPLRNERVELPGGLDLAGVNDVTGASFDDGPDFAKALDGRDPGKPVVLLAHQPIQVHDAAKHGVDLQLSGHTHGGQMAPFNLAVKLQQPVVSGYDTIDGTQIYVTNGAGFWGPPVRVGAPPDITLVELRTP